MDKDRLRSIVQGLIEGRTNTEIAAGVHVDHSLVSHWRKGTRLPSGASLTRLLAFVEADPDTCREALTAFHGLPADGLDALMGSADPHGDDPATDCPPTPAHDTTGGVR